MFVLQQTMLSEKTKCELQDSSFQLVTFYYTNIILHNDSHKAFPVPARLITTRNKLRTLHNVQ